MRRQIIRQLCQKPQEILPDFRGFLVQMAEKMQAGRMPGRQAVFIQRFPNIVIANAIPKI